MRIALYTNAVSTHQLPLAREIVRRIGVENFRYIHTGEKGQSFQTVRDVADLTVLREDEGDAREWLDEADVVLVGGIRPIDLIERRAAKGLKTLYQSERWFKPFGVGVVNRCRCRLELPGSLRMLVPRYRRMAKRFVKLVNENDCVKFLPIGPHAKRDFLKMGVRADKLVPWGYFVSPGVEKRCRCRKEGEPLKVLWAGRVIPLKHVSDIERAVVLSNKNLTSALHLHLDSTPILFTKLTGVTSAEVRAAMRSHDTFVFASNGYEGWGAVVSEALEEGMNVICSSDCGSGPAMLPRARLFKCGDIGALAKLLEAEYCGELPLCSIGDWTAENAAKRLMNMI